MAKNKEQPPPRSSHGNDEPSEELGAAKQIDDDQCVASALIEEPSVVKAILRHLGKPTEVPMTAPARAPPQVEFAWRTECASSDWVEPA